MAERMAQGLAAGALQKHLRQRLRDGETGQALDREITTVDLEAPLDRLRRVAGGHDSQAPGLGARLRLDVDPDERGATAGVREERERPSAQRAFEGGVVGNALDLHPRNVAHSDLGGPPADLHLAVGRQGRGEDGELTYGGEERGSQQEAGRPGLHSGRCSLRNCSISATSSEAGGRSLVPAAAGGASSTSLASSFVT